MNTPIKKMERAIRLLLAGSLGFTLGFWAFSGAQADEKKDATLVPQQEEAPQAKTCSSEDDTACDRWYYMTEKGKPDAWKSDHPEFSKRQRWYHVGHPVKPVAPKIIVLEGVHFDFDKSDIRPDAIPILEKNLPELQREDIHVTIVGHADDRGSVEYNQGLSERRAQAIRNFYISRGIPPERLSAEGHSKLDPVAVNEPHQPGASVKAENDGLHVGRALNRRIEMHIRSVASAPID